MNQSDETPVRHETLLTAAKRIVRFIRVDDLAEGGLLSKDTVVANETLARMIEHEERQATITKEPKPDAQPQPTPQQQPR